MDSDLWIEALSYFAHRDDDCQHEIGEVLNNIDRENLLPPLPIIQILSQKVRLYKRVRELMVVPFPDARLVCTNSRRRN
jgi:hypothetical protein